MLSALKGLASPDAAAREAAIASLGSTLSIDQLRDRVGDIEPLLEDASWRVRSLAQQTLSATLSGKSAYASTGGSSGLPTTTKASRAEMAEVAKKGAAMAASFGGPITRPQGQERVDRIVEGLADQLGDRVPAVSGCVRRSKAAIPVATRLCACCCGWYFRLYTRVYAALSAWPADLLRLVFGLSICFFGGLCWASLAAIEAARQLGLAQLADELRVIRKEWARVIEASDADDKVDADADGTPDVQQLSARELVDRKARVAVLAVSDPARLERAFGAPAQLAQHRPDARARSSSSGGR